MTSFLSYLGNKNLDGRKDGGHFYSPPLGRGTNNNNNNNDNDNKSNSRNYLFEISNIKFLVIVTINK